MSSHHDRAVESARKAHAASQKAVVFAGLALVANAVALAARVWERLR